MRRYVLWSSRVEGRNSSPGWLDVRVMMWLWRTSTSGRRKQKPQCSLSFPPPLSHFSAWCSASHAVIQWKQWSAPTPWLMSSTNQRHYFLVIRARIGCPVCQTRESSWGAGSLVLGTLSGVQEKEKKQLWFLSAVYDVMTKPSWNACKTHCLQFFVLSSLKQFGAVYKLHFARLQCCTVHHEHCGFVGELMASLVSL